MCHIFPEILIYSGTKHNIWSSYWRDPIESFRWLLLLTLLIANKRHILIIFFVQLVPKVRKGTATFALKMQAFIVVKYIHLNKWIIYDWVETTDADVSIFSIYFFFWKSKSFLIDNNVLSFLQHSKMENKLNMLICVFQVWKTKTYLLIAVELSNCFWMTDNSFRISLFNQNKKKCLAPWLNIYYARNKGTQIFINFPDIFFCKSKIRIQSTFEFKVKLDNYFWENFESNLLDFF